MAISVVPGLDTDRIMALNPDAMLSPYANARWPDHLPEVIASVMKRNLAATGKFSTIEASSSLSADGWLLDLELQQFYGIQSSTGETSNVRVEMVGSLECGGNMTAVNLSESNPVAQERLAAVVAAHQRGLNGVTRQLLEQINQTCP
jgi:ABC-type uncharacterized transport system auxiliary subunit